MTIVFTVASRDLIVMTADSAVALDFEESPREYETGRKLYPFPGVGCVGTWGSRDGNQIGRFLSGQRISSTTHSVVDLADLVHEYLTSEYCPREYGLGEVGYHIAGYDPQGRPYVSHVFWGYDIPRPEGQLEPKYERYAQSPPGENAVIFLYNGRSDLAHVLVHMLLDQVRQGRATNFDASPLGLIRFADFIVRFAGELTPEVGPPFYTYVITPDSCMLRLINKGFSRLDPGDIPGMLQALEPGLTY